MRFFALLFLSLPAFAQVESFQIGEELNHVLSLCATKESAIAVVDADAKGGQEAAMKVFAEKDCNTFPVSGATVGHVVYTTQISRADGKRTARVVEILVQGKAVAYFLTTKPVVAELKVEPKRGNKS